MADLTVTITVSLPGVIEGTREEVSTVPPDYDDRDIRMFVGHAVESIGARLLGEKGFPAPVRLIMLGNAARLMRLEALVGATENDSLREVDALREPFTVDAPEAIERWGEGLFIEG
jgi:hypothetical protein